MTDTATEYVFRSTRLVTSVIDEINVLGRILSPRQNVALTRLPDPQSFCTGNTPTPREEGSVSVRSLSTGSGTVISDGRWRTIRPPASIVCNSSIGGATVNLSFTTDRMTVDQKAAGGTF